MRGPWVWWQFQVRLVATHVKIDYPESGLSVVEASFDFSSEL